MSSMLHLLRPSRQACRHLHTARPVLNATSSAAASTPAAPAAAAARPAPVSEIRFPVSARRQAYMAAKALAAHPPPRQPKKVHLSAPRAWFKRSSPPSVTRAERPVRVQAGAATRVEWKVNRLASGLLPVMRVTPTVHENSKAVLHISRVTGDIASLAAELQLLAGPMFEVKLNYVGSVVHVHPTPKSEVDEKFANRVRQWLISIGM